jgi:hypothetical protein
VGKIRRGVARKVVLRSVVGATICAMLVLFNSGLAGANDKPAGFWYGADGSGPAPSGTQMPSPCAGYYAFYSGRVNTTDDTYMKTGDANQAQTNANNGHGIGVFAYGDLDGPSSYSGFNGSTSEATAWGEEQADAFANNYDYYIDYEGLEEPSYSLVFADMEQNNPGWYWSGDTGGYSNWQTLNRDVFNGFWSEIQTWTIPDGVQMEAAYYTGPEFYNTYMPNQTMPNTWLWEASWAYTSIDSSDCLLNGFTAPDGFSPQSIFGQSTSSACFGFWQWASTDSQSQDWDQTDQNKLNSGSCPE